MSNFSLLVNVFFRLLNFAILIFILRFIFKNYLLETIKKKIQERHDYLRGLETHLHTALSERDALITQIDQESVSGTQIEKKIVRWAEVIEADRKSMLREKEAIMRKVAAHVAERETALEVLHARNTVIPQAIDATEQALKSELADPKLNGMVVRRIMQSMRAKKHG